jgi:hypothetical protein
MLSVRSSPPTRTTGLIKRQLKRQHAGRQLSRYHSAIKPCQFGSKCRIRRPSAPLLPPQNKTILPLKFGQTASFKAAPVAVHRENN